MGAMRPTVLYPLTLSMLLDYILTTQSSSNPTTLLICASRDQFLRQLALSVRQQCGAKTHEDAGRDGFERLLAPTLLILFTARHVQVTFCASVQTLLAYLTAYSGASTKKDGVGGGRERIVLVNALSLHAATSSFSVQGLSRVFAAAVETSLRVGAQLHFAECQATWRHTQTHGEDDETAMNGEDGGNTHVEEADPWEQEVSILNVSARRFGSGTNDRAWVGRTVKVKRIAGRWLHFQNLQQHLPPT